MRAKKSMVLILFGIWGIVVLASPVRAEGMEVNMEWSESGGTLPGLPEDGYEKVLLAESGKSEEEVISKEESELSGRADSDLSEEIDDLERELLSELSLDDVDDVLAENEETENLSFSDIMKQLLDTEHQPDKKDIAEQLFRLAFSDLSQCKTMFVQILILTIAFAFLNNFINVFENSQISKTGFYMYFLVLMVLLMKSYFLMDNMIQQVMGQTIEFMQAVIPAFCMTMVFASAKLSAAAFYQIAIVVIYLVERLLLYIIAPGIHIYVVLQMLNCMTGEKMISRITALLKKTIKWSLRALLAGVTGINIIENMIAPSIDNLQKMSVTKTLGMIPGLGGTAEAVSNILLGSAVVIKNGAGAAAMIILLFICISPMLKMIVFALLYKLAGAIVQPFADPRVCGCIDSVGEGAAMLLKTMVTGILLFMITIAVVLTAVR